LSLLFRLVSFSRTASDTLTLLRLNLNR